MKHIWLLIAMIGFLGGCTGVDTENDQTDVQGLDSVEIRSYKGEKLGSVDDFRENSIKEPQQVGLEDYELEITGLVDSPQRYTYEEVLSHTMYSKVVTLDCVEGWSVKLLWEGVKVMDLLEEAGISRDANTIIFYAHDGYSTSLTTDYIRENDILLAYKMNDVVLSPERGFPFQLVAEDKWGYKWIKWVTRIEASDDESFRGYWEGFGYNQDGSADGPRFE